MSLDWLAPKTLGRLVVVGIACGSSIHAAAFFSDLSVSVQFPGRVALPANTSLGNGAASVLPPCTVLMIGNATAFCGDPTSMLSLPIVGAQTLQFGAGPAVGATSPTGFATATSMGVSDEAVFANLNAFAVMIPITLSYQASLIASAGALESTTATYSFDVTNNGVGLLPGGPNTFTLTCNACGTMTANNPVALPANPVNVMVPAMVGGNVGVARVRIDPFVSGTADSAEVPEASPGLLVGCGALLIFVSRRLGVLRQ